MRKIKHTNQKIISNYECSQCKGDFKMKELGYKLSNKTDTVSGSFILLSQH